MNRYGKMLIALGLTGAVGVSAVPFSQSGTVQAADDEVTVIEDGIQSDLESSQLQDSSVSSEGGSLFEDQNTNVQRRDGITAKKGTEARKMVGSFVTTGLIRSITYDYGNKPSLSSLLAQFPGEEQVFLVGDKKPTTLKVSWQCVGEDYESSQGRYFLFAPVFDDQYEVRQLSVTTESPYIEVRQNPEVAVEMIESAPPTVNEKEIFRYCTEDLGLSGAAACGILANVYCESGFRTNAIGDSGTSVGICQWHNGRWTRLRSYTDDWQTLKGQLDYMTWELGHGYSATLNYLRHVTDDAQGAYDAANFWCLHFEMPDSARTRGITRGYLAMNIYWPRYGEDYDETVRETENLFEDSEDAAAVVGPDLASGIEIVNADVSPAEETEAEDTAESPETERQRKLSSGAPACGDFRSGLR